jgi:hypothetical protein
MAGIVAASLTLLGVLILVLVAFAAARRSWVRVLKMGASRSRCRQGDAGGWAYDIARHRLHCGAAREPQIAA